VPLDLIAVRLAAEEENLEADPSVEMAPSGDRREVGH